MTEVPFFVPDGWRVVPFREVREWLQYGTSVRCTEEPLGFPVLRIPNIEPARVNACNLKYCHLSEAEAKPYLLEHGDLLFIRTNGVLERLGTCAAYNGENERALFASYLIRARLKDGIDPRYVAYFYSSQLGAALIAGRATPAADGKYNINTGIIDSLPLLLPPTLDDQRSIATVLDKLQEALRLQDTGAEIAQEVKSKVIAELFTRGLRGEARRDSEMGSIPMSWVPTKVADFATHTQYGISLRGQKSGRYPILRMNCQLGGKVVMRDLQYVDLSDDVFSAFKLSPGDILFNRTNSIEHVGRTAIFSDQAEAVFASYLIRVRLDAKRCLPEYFNHFMNWSSTQRDIKKLASRAVGQANISASKLRTVLVPLPTTTEEQQEIVDVLNAIDRKMELYQQKLTILEELFKALLHKLLTGEIDVNALDLAPCDLRGETGITHEHVKKNRDVRRLLTDRDIVPEELPAAEDVKKLERRLKSEANKLPKHAPKLASQKRRSAT